MELIVFREQLYVLTMMTMLFIPLLSLEHQFCVWEKSGAHRFVHGVTWSGSSWYSIYTLWTGISVPEDMKSQRCR